MYHLRFSWPLTLGVVIIIVQYCKNIIFYLMFSKNANLVNFIIIKLNIY